MSNTVVVPFNTGCRFTYGGWNALFMMSQDLGVGNYFQLAVDIPNTGLQPVVNIEGPRLDWTSYINSLGGMGNYLHSKEAEMNAALEILNTDPAQWPVLSNSTPFSVQNFNIVLLEYMRVVPKPGTTVPMVQFKGYP